eukprot:TRINITY_DN3521_c0_g1_i3.p1 TRINITY_DN3521_c0_g1~~TRINITY_DN3521_c0_g1_i3.p1  ORF type:complete len:633 (+),score=91.93 TRINITY_DN3521_c0_g1_i3:120-2018(+)
MDTPSLLRERDEELLHKGLLMQVDEDGQVTEELFAYLYPDLFLCFSHNEHAREMRLKLTVRFASLDTLSKGNLSGFMITLKKQEKHRFWVQNPEELSLWIIHLRKICFQSNYERKYQVVKTLFRSRKSEVILLQSREDKNTTVVGKFVPKEFFINRPDRLRLIKNEIVILNALDHPGIIKLYELFQNETWFILILEHMRGGTLFDKVAGKKRYDEREAALVIRDLMEAICYLETKNILHRDIKLENLFLPIEDNNLKVKVGDFDLASPLAEVDHSKQCGTPGYMAPEVFFRNYGGYSVKTDVFSSGVVLFTILTGSFPFRATNMTELYEKNRICAITFKSDIYDKLSAEGKDLLTKMLARDPADRPGPKEVLNHPWITKTNSLARSSPSVEIPFIRNVRSDFGLQVPQPPEEGRTDKVEKAEESSKCLKATKSIRDDSPRTKRGRKKSRLDSEDSVQKTTPKFNTRNLEITEPNLSKGNPEPIKKRLSVFQSTKVPLNKSDKEPSQLASHQLQMNQNEAKMEDGPLLSKMSSISSNFMNSFYKPSDISTVRNITSRIAREKSLHNMKKSDATTGKEESVSLPTQRRGASLDENISVGDEDPSKLLFEKIKALVTPPKKFLFGNNFLAGKSPV